MKNNLESGKKFEQKKSVRVAYAIAALICFVSAVPGILTENIFIPFSFAVGVIILTNISRSSGKMPLKETLRVTRKGIRKGTISQWLIVIALIISAVAVLFLFQSIVDFIFLLLLIIGLGASAAIGESEITKIDHLIRISE